MQGTQGKSRTDRLVEDVATNGERGFVLITVIVLLAILTIAATTSMFKTNVQSKVAAGSEDTERAFAAMMGGLSNTFAYWQYDTVSGQKEFASLVDWIHTGSWSDTSTNPATAHSTAPSIYVGDTKAYAQQLFDSANGLGADLAAVDNWVRTTAGVRVYKYTGGGIAADTQSNWGKGKDPQVAIWVTSFDAMSSDNAFPYVPAKAKLVTGTGNACSACSLVTYALGASGSVRRLSREGMSASSNLIRTYGAMVNAPKYNDKNDWCDNGTAASTKSTPATTVSGGGVSNTHVIDATQAPGGVAIASNSAANFPKGSKGFRGASSSSVAGLNITPWVAFDPGKIVQAGYPKIEAGDMNAYQAKVLSGDRFGTANYIDYFDSANSQLFQIDAYREAANRISGLDGETIGTYKVTTGGATLGKAAALKSANKDATGNTYGRTGTLQWSEARYNIENGIPMYGLVRVMIPSALETGKDISCPGGYKVTGYNPSFKFPSSSTTKGSEVTSGTGRKLIVYGALLIDFFYDKDNNEIYDPASEKLLTVQEALTAYMKISVPIMVNPAMDGLGLRSGSTDTDYNEISSYPNGAPSWDQTTDKLGAGDGAMDLMWDIKNVATYWSSMVHDGASTYKFTNFRAWINRKNDGTTAWLSTEKDKMYNLLDYYYRTSAGAADSTKVEYYPSNSDAVNYGIAKIEAAPTSFYIDSPADLKDKAPSAADIFHVFLPSGYVHGWKRAFAETGLGDISGSGTIWSEKLLGTSSPYYNSRSRYFNVKRIGTKVYIDKDFADMPAEMYAGGVFDMHEQSNISGLVYTPGPLELEQKSATAHQYINGVVVTGYGAFFEEKGAITIIVYDDISLDRLPTTKSTTKASRNYWQELR